MNPVALVGRTTKLLIHRGLWQARRRIRSAVCASLATIDKVECD
jgi:hypothetical protein